MDLDKLLETGDKCIHDEPPSCEAACPLHLDVKTFISEIERGDLKKAYKIMEKRIPFTKIIGRICDHPCEAHCVRKEAGGAIAISELERYVVTEGYSPPKKTLPMPKNKGRVAVIGGGISGLTAAFDLDRKGYRVTLYEKSNRLGGGLWSYAGKGLDSEIIEEELQKIAAMDIELCLNTSLQKDDLKEILQQYDALYLATGEWQEKLQINPHSLQVEGTSIFAGGGLIDRESMVMAASSGRRAAISIDRYISKVSLTASREREGIFETPLRFETEDEEPLNRVKKTEAVFNREEAAKEAGRCFKCQCVKCIKACSHMRSFNISPDAYVRQINHNERIILGTHYANKMINSCTLCGLCREECHLNISMKAVVQETRESMVEKNKMPVSAHDFALKDMAFSNSQRFSLVRGQPSKEQSKHLFYYPLISYSKYVQGLFLGTGKTAYLFYPGCQLPASFPDYIEEIYRYLVGSLKGDVGIYLGCCGAPADWAGRKQQADENAKEIRRRWEEMDRPTFILACSSCSSIFEKYLPEIKTISLWEIFADYGLPVSNNRIQERHILNVHDACATRYNTKIHDSIRKIAYSLGYQLQELKYTKERTKCCGYGGLVYFANRQQAEAFVEERVREGSGDMLVYCAMCKDLFVSGGKKTYHILDLLYGNATKETGLRRMPTLSERQYNRAMVKKRLLKEIWGEEAMTAEEEFGYNLIISEDIKHVMAERYILLEDIQRVIDNAQRNKERFYNVENSSYLTRLRMDNVTFWVQYEEMESNINILSVYSHRMEVVEE